MFVYPVSKQYVFAMDGVVKPLVSLRGGGAEDAPEETQLLFII